MQVCANCGRPFDGFTHPGDPCDVCGASVDGIADPGRHRRYIARERAYAVSLTRALNRTRQNGDLLGEEDVLRALREVSR